MRLFMNKKLLLTVLYLFNCRAMDQQHLEQETRKFFADAFQDFGLNAGEFELKLDFPDSYQVKGYASLKQKKIGLTRGIKASKDVAEFCANHEVAHCADTKLHFFQKYIEPTTQIGTHITSTMALTAGSICLSDRILSKFISELSPKAALAIAGTLFATCAIASIPFVPYLTRPLHYQFEHRANIGACKKLIQKNKFKGIADFLVRLKAMELQGKSRTAFYHPPIKEEFAEIVSCLNAHDYDVRVRKFPEQRVIDIQISKDGQEKAIFNAKY